MLFDLFHWTSITIDEDENVNAVFKERTNKKKFPSKTRLTFGHHNQMRCEISGALSSIIDRDNSMFKLQLVQWFGCRDPWTKILFMHSLAGPFRNVYFSADKRILSNFQLPVGCLLEAQRWLFFCLRNLFAQQKLTPIEFLNRLHVKIDSFDGFCSITSNRIGIRGSSVLFAQHKVKKLWNSTRTFPQSKFPIRWIQNDQLMTTAFDSRKRETFRFTNRKKKKSCRYSRGRQHCEPFNANV